MIGSIPSRMPCPPTCSVESGVTGSRYSSKSRTACACCTSAWTETIRQKDEANARLAEEVSYLRQKLFGASSEKRPDIDPNQLSLFDVDEGMEIPVADAEEIPETVVKEHTRKRKKKPTLEEQFPGARVNRIVVDSLSEEEKQCPVCGTEMMPIGTEVIRREVEFIPAKYEVTEYVATTYECPQCKQTEEPQFVKDEGCPPALLSNHGVFKAGHICCFRETLMKAFPAQGLRREVAYSSANLCAFLENIPALRKVIES